MKVFLDTSVLVKLYLPEPGRENLLTFLFGGNTQQIVLSQLAVLEFRSAVFRKFRTGKIAEEELTSVLDLFARDIPKFWIIEISPATLEQSVMLILKHGKQGLRSLDALQLSTAKMARNQVDVLLTDDLPLLAFMEAEQLQPLSTDRLP